MDSLHPLKCSEAHFPLHASLSDIRYYCYFTFAREITSSFMLCTLTKYHMEDQIKRMRGAEHVDRMGHRRGAYRFFINRSVERSNLEDLSIDGSIN